MSSNTFYGDAGDDLSLGVVREESEDAPVVLTITVGEDKIRIYCGRFFDSADALATELEGLARSAREIVTDWRDVPDADGDGFVFDSGRDGYIVQLEGLHWNGTKLVSMQRFPSRDWRSFPTREIAEYELARAMEVSGVFPNTWYQDERGWSEDLGGLLGRFFDPADGGTTVRPLEGVEYADYDDVIADGWSAYVVKDYGTLGVVYVLSGDDAERWTDDRSIIVARPDEDDEG